MLVRYSQSIMCIVQCQHNATMGKLMLIAGKRFNWVAELIGSGGATRNKVLVFPPVYYASSAL